MQSMRTEDAEQWELGCVTGAQSSMVLEIKLTNGILKEATHSGKF